MSLQSGVVSSISTCVAPKAKMRRMKTYIGLCNLSKMLSNAGISIADFLIEKLPDGSLPDPFTWRHLNMSSDRASDEVCTSHVQ